MNTVAIQRIAVLVLGLATAGGATAQAGKISWENQVSPYRKYDAMIASDPVRQRVVFLAPAGGDTFEWDGQRWRWKSASGPSPRNGGRMAYDPVRRTVLQFGGASVQGQLFGDLWEWDGRDWRAVPFTTGPSPRAGHAMATDFVRSRVVLFGGGDASALLDDTWEWDGTKWTLMNPKHRPPRRVSHAMGLSLVAPQGVLMWGGYAGNDDPRTWRWDGTDWIDHGTMGAPDVRQDHGLALDPGSNAVILFGGNDKKRGGNTPLPETYAWTGSGWIQLGATLRAGALTYLTTDWARREVLAHSEVDFTATLSPGGWLVRDRHRGFSWTGPEFRRPMGPVYDWRRDEMVFVASENRTSSVIKTFQVRGDVASLSPPPPVKYPYWWAAYAAFEGRSGRVLIHAWSNATPAGAETFVWDGVAWQPFVQPSGPIPTEFGGQMVADYATGRLLLVTESMVVWEWTAANGWKMHPPVLPQPPHRQRFGLAYDPVLRRLVLYSGESTTYPYPGDTWAYDGTKWSQLASGPKLQSIPPPMFWSDDLGGIVLLYRRATTGNPVVDPWLLGPSGWTMIGETVGDPLNKNSIGPFCFDSARQEIRCAMNWQFTGHVRSLWVDQQSPRPGETLTFTLHVPRRAGDLAILGAAFSDRPGIPLRPVPGVGTQVLPLAPDAMLWASLAQSWSAKLGTTGVATFRLPIPPMSGLVGLDLRAAAFTLDPWRPEFGAISNAAAFEIIR